MYFKSEPGREQLGSYYQLKINYLWPFLYSVFFFFWLHVYISDCILRRIAWLNQKEKKSTVRSFITYVGLQQLSSLTENAAVILLDREWLLVNIKKIYKTCLNCDYLLYLWLRFKYLSNFKKLNFELITFKSQFKKL